MLVVRIELWPWGEEARKKQLATIAIANTGAGNLNIGDYTFAVSHQEGSKFGNGITDPKDLIRHPELAWKHGSLGGFERRKGAVALVLAVLRKAFKR